MPKTRRSNTVSSQGSGGAGGVSIADREIAERLNNRLEEVRAVTVSLPSRSRGRVENVEVSFDGNSNFATVLSGSGVTYNVDHVNGTCDCMHFRTTGDSCRHMDAVNIARGQNLASTGAQTPINGQVLNESEINNLINRRIQLDREDEENRRVLLNESEDDEFFYSEHTDEFNNTISNITDADIPYEYENVLNGSNNTFGVEIEFVGGNANAIAKELYDLGICAYDKRVQYHASGVSGKWKLERDGSVSDGSGGGELVSPVLKDTPETWRNIEIICEVAKRHGARIDHRCGAHVHMGMEPLDTARQRWRRFFKSIGSFEECIYRISGGDSGEIRSGYSHYAMPFSNRASDASTFRFRLDNEEDINNLARSASNYDRYYGINLTNIYHYGKPNTVEFRYFNGTVNAKQIQANVKIANGVIMASQKARTKQSEGVTDSMIKRGNLLKNSYNHRSDSQAMKFVDIFFTRKKDKDAILNVYKKNTWR